MLPAPPVRHRVTRGTGVRAPVALEEDIGVTSLRERETTSHAEQDDGETEQERPPEQGYTTPTPWGPAIVEPHVYDALQVSCIRGVARSLRRGVFLQDRDDSGPERLEKLRHEQPDPQQLENHQRRYHGELCRRNGQPYAEDSETGGSSQLLDLLLFIGAGGGLKHVFRFSRFDQIDELFLDPHGDRPGNHHCVATSYVEVHNK